MCAETGASKSGPRGPCMSLADHTRELQDRWQRMCKESTCHTASLAIVSGHVSTYATLTGRICLSVPQNSLNLLQMHSLELFHLLPVTVSGVRYSHSFTCKWTLYFKPSPFFFLNQHIKCSLYFSAASCFFSWQLQDI